MTKDNAKLEMYLATTAAVIVVAAFFVVTLFVVPDFERLFTVAEFDLPLMTKLAVASNLYWNVFGVVAIVGAVLVSKSKYRIGWLLIAIGGVAFFAMIPFLVTAMYEPIFQL